jgi:hypothetical protein
LQKIAIHCSKAPQNLAFATVAKRPTALQILNCCKATQEPCEFAIFAKRRKFAYFHLAILQLLQSAAKTFTFAIVAKRPKAVQNYHCSKASQSPATLQLLQSAANLCTLQWFQIASNLHIFHYCKAPQNLAIVTKRRKALQICNCSKAPQNLERRSFANLQLLQGAAKTVQIYNCCKPHALQICRVVAMRRKALQVCGCATIANPTALAALCNHCNLQSFAALCNTCRHKSSK